MNAEKTLALPLRAINWSCHAPTTIVGNVDGVQVVYAECSGHGRHSDQDARIAAEIAHRCNSNEQLVAALTDAREALAYYAELHPVAESAITQAMTAREAIATIDAALAAAKVPT
jgi:hypothetical protein